MKTLPGWRHSTGEQAVPLNHAVVHIAGVTQCTVWGLYVNHACLLLAWVMITCPAGCISGPEFDLRVLAVLQRGRGADSPGQQAGGCSACPAQNRLLCCWE